MQDAVLKVTDLKKHYDIHRSFQPPLIVKALDGVSFELKANETLAIVGESGCGKSTLAKTLMKIEKKTDGGYTIHDKNAYEYESKEFQKKIQMIFQDPYSSINPRKKAWQIISEPLMINTDYSKEKCFELAKEAMENVGLRPELANRYPHMFSGGQRQRIGIARALIQHPEILICDEPVSALDVSIQAQVLNLLIDLQDQLKLSYIFISHDLSVVEHLADKVAVMYLGKIVEFGTKEQIFNSPTHPYTKGLLSSTPHVKKQTQFKPLSGELPSPLDPPTGCSFHKRCPYATETCHVHQPILNKFNGREVSCHLVDEINEVE